MFTSSLRKAAPGNQDPWTLDQLKAGLAQFELLYKRPPTAYEIDDFPYLPSSRSIQRSYGGLIKLRGELLGESLDFTTGKYRSVKAKQTYSGGKNYERLFYAYLLSVFQDISVHEQKVIRPGEVSCDFFIYLQPNEGVVIDIFYAENMRNLVNIINIKLKRYCLINQETYLVVVGNSGIGSVTLDAKMKNKKLPLPAHITVMTEDRFKSVVVAQLQQRSCFLKEPKLNI